jgi:hypothetical protein
MDPTTSLASDDDAVVNPQTRQALPNLSSRSSTSSASSVCHPPQTVLQCSYLSWRGVMR